MLTGNNRIIIVNMKKVIWANVLLFAKGVFIGGCMIVPGMSAGTVIVLCGLYGTLIGYINGLFKSKKQFIDAVAFAIPLALGAVVGIVALSRVLEFLIDKCSLPVFALFAGLVLGSIPLMLGITYTKKPKADSKAKEKDTKDKPNATAFKWWHLIPAIIACGVAVVFALLQAPETGVKALSVTTGIMLVIAGAITIAAMIIPGISGAFLLVLMGYYETLLNAASTINVPVLALFALGAPVGLIIAAKGIGFFLKRFRIATHMVIVGFLVGSVAGIFMYPGTYDSATNAWGIVAASVLFVLGLALVVILSRLQKNKEDFFKL